MSLSDLPTPPSFLEKLLRGQREALIGQTYMRGVRGEPLQEIIEHLNAQVIPYSQIVQICGKLNELSHDAEFSAEEKAQLVHIARTIQEKYNHSTCRIAEAVRFGLSSTLNDIVHKKKTVAPKKLGSDDFIEKFIQRIREIATSIETVNGQTTYRFVLRQDSVEETNNSQIGVPVATC